MAIPLAAHGEVLGALTVGRRPGRQRFTRADMDVAEDFATQAALVLSVAESQAAAEEAELNEERARIAQELHERVIQRVFTAGLRLQGLAGRVPARHSAALDEVVAGLDDVVREIRGSVYSYESVPTAATALHGQLLLIARQARQVLGHRPTVLTDGPIDSAVPEPVARDLLAVVREAVTAASRHLRPEETEIRVVARDRVVLEIRVRGCLPGAPAPADTVVWASRATAHGGACTAAFGDSGAGILTWWVPLPEP